MNVKRYLKQQAKKDYQEILSSDNGEILRTLEKRVAENPKLNNRPSRTKAMIACAASALAVVVIICAVVFLPADNSVVYLEDNFMLVDSTIDELNADMAEFSLNIDTLSYSTIVKKTVDSVSGDVIFYQVNYVQLDSFIEFDLVTVCNKNYKYKEFDETDVLIRADLPSYSIAYQTSITSDPDFGLDMLHGSAEINKGKEYVYIINYRELMLDETGSFLDIIQKTVLTKQTREADHSPIAKN